MESLAPIFAVPLWSWQPRQFAAFLGFANQMAGLVPLNQLKKEAFLLFVFTGEDAELQAHELRALLQFKAMLHMKIFRACRGSLLNGCTAALTMSPKDLQKIVIREERGGGGQRGGAKEE